MGESLWSPTPAAPTMATLQKWIAGYAGMPNDDEALEMALAGIRQAIDKINARDWNWAIVYEDITFASDTIDYPVTSNFKKPYRLVLLDSDGNSRDRLPFVPWKPFLEEYKDQASEGNPCVYTVANIKEFGTISLDVLPRLNWVIDNPTGRLWYYRNVQYSNNDGQPDWPSNFSPFVMAWAEGFVADRYAFDKARPAYQRAMIAWQDLVRDDNNTQTDWE